MLENGAAHLLGVAALPMHHRDPFDHLLIAQAMAEDAVLVSEGRDIGRYPVRVVGCSEGLGAGAN